MKNLFGIILLFAISACGDEAENGMNNDPSDTSKTADTTYHPDGVTSGSVISRDTAAMRVDSAPER